MENRQQVRQEPARRQVAGNDSIALLPPVNVIEDEGGITVSADLPGVTRENLTIRVEGGALTIEAPLALGESQVLDPVYSEVRSAHYKRSFTLSRELDSSKIDAAIKDGVLTLKVPKLEQAKPRRIEVKTG
ncbi:Hsp20/alpha crystallin family protein [soil metagenome]